MWIQVDFSRPKYRRKRPKDRTWFYLLPWTQSWSNFLVLIRRVRWICKWKKCSTSWMKMQAQRCVCVPACEHTHTWHVCYRVSALCPVLSASLPVSVPTLCLCFCMCLRLCLCICTRAYKAHMTNLCVLCVQIFFHEFRDGLRRLETTPPIQFTAEDWNTHVISRGLAMTDGQLDIQVPHVCLMCNKDLWRIVGVARLTRLSVQTFKTLMSVHLKEVYFLFPCACLLTCAATLSSFSHALVPRLSASLSGYSMVSVRTS